MDDQPRVAGQPSGQCLVQHRVDPPHHRRVERGPQVLGDPGPGVPVDEDPGRVGVAAVEQVLAQAEQHPPGHGVGARVHSREHGLGIGARRAQQPVDGAEQQARRDGQGAHGRREVARGQRQLDAPGERAHPPVAPGHGEDVLRVRQLGVLVRVQPLAEALPPLPVPEDVADLRGHRADDGFQRRHQALAQRARQ